MVSFYIRKRRSRLRFRSPSVVPTTNDGRQRNKNATSSLVSVPPHPSVYQVESQVQVLNSVAEGTTSTDCENSNDFMRILESIPTGMTDDDMLRNTKQILNCRTIAAPFMWDLILTTGVNRLTCLQYKSVCAFSRTWRRTDQESTQQELPHYTSIFRFRHNVLYRKLACQHRTLQLPVSLTTRGARNRNVQNETEPTTKVKYIPPQNYAIVDVQHPILFKCLLQHGKEQITPPYVHFTPHIAHTSLWKYRRFYLDDPNWITTDVPSDESVQIARTGDIIELTVRGSRKN